MENLSLRAFAYLFSFLSVVTWLFSGLHGSHLWQWWSSLAHACPSAWSWMPVWYHRVGISQTPLSATSKHMLVVPFMLLCYCLLPAKRPHQDPHRLFSLDWETSLVYIKQSSKLSFVSCIGSFILVYQYYLVSLCIPWNSMVPYGDLAGLQTCNNPPASCLSAGIAGFTFMLGSI